MHLYRFGRRCAMAFVVMALVLFAHERHQLQLAQTMGWAVLLVWVVLEIAHAYRRRHTSGSAASPKG